MTDFKERPLGVIPSPQDVRDYSITTITPVRVEFPREFVCQYLPDIYDQNGYGMCVAFSIAAIKEAQEFKERGKKARYSPAFIYGNRAPEDYQGEGMMPREALRAMYRYGVVGYDNLPGLGNYPTCRDMVKNMNPVVFAAGIEQKINTYMRLNTPAEVKTALMDLGPVLLTIAVYDSFYNVSKTGIVYDVKEGESIQGYHAMTAVGWKKINGRDHYIVHNSWSTGFGDNGKCYIPVDYKGLNELWSVTDYIRPTITKEIKMNTPMQIIEPGHTMLPFRAIYEALGANVEWGRLPNGKVWAKATVPANKESVVVYTEQDNDIMKVTS